MLKFVTKELCLSEAGIRAFSQFGMRVMGAQPKNSVSAVSHNIHSPARGTTAYSKAGIMRKA